MEENTNSSTFEENSKSNEINKVEDFKTPLMEDVNLNENLAISQQTNYFDVSTNAPSLINDKDVESINVEVSGGDKNDSDVLKIVNSQKNRATETSKELPSSIISSNNNGFDSTTLASSSVIPNLTLDDPVINAIERSIANAEGTPHIKVRIVEPQKVGEGMSAYVVYKLVTTIYNVPGLQPQNEGEEWHVIRRFSDFLGLHDKLVAKYANLGYIIPPPPSKSLIGMTKLKMGSKDDTFSADFAERRRAALERYMNRTANYPVFMRDPSLHEFLQAEGELPRSANTAALSGNNVMKMINKVATDFTQKLTTFTGSTPAYNRTDEADHWFEDMQNQIDNLDTQMHKLHASVEALVHHRKELSTGTANFSKSLALLSNSEENSALSRALSQLAQVEERLEQITGTDILNLNPSVQIDQFGNDTTNLMVGLAHNDFFVLSEILKDYIGLIGAVKQAFDYRVKAFNQLAYAQSQSTKKRKDINALGIGPGIPTPSVPNSSSNADANSAVAKIAQLRVEIKEWDERVIVAQKDFELISANIKKEVCRFEKERIREFKDTFVLYLQNLLKAQQQIVKCWEAFLPEAKAIA